MPLNLEAKKAIVAEVSDIATRSISAVAAEYRGLDMGEMTALRCSARDAGIYLRVVRNTLARRAFKETDLACMHEGLKGQLILAFSLDDPGSAARVMRDFYKSNDKLVLKLVTLEGKLLPVSSVDMLADLPSKDEALSRLASVMLAPVRRLVGTLAGPHTKLVRTVKAIADRK